MHSKIFESCIIFITDLTLINCYNHSSMKPEERDATMLASAKANLEKMAFFGLTEFQENSQYLFEETFNLKYVSCFIFLLLSIFFGNI